MKCWPVYRYSPIGVLISVNNEISFTKNAASLNGSHPWVFKVLSQTKGINIDISVQVCLAVILRNFQPYGSILGEVIRFSVFFISPSK